MQELLNNILNDIDSTKELIRKIDDELNLTYEAVFKVKAVEYQTLANNATTTIDVAPSTVEGLSSVGIEQFTLAKFVAPSSGTYTFECTGRTYISHTGSYNSTDPCARLYNSDKSSILASDDDTAGNSNFKIEQELTADTTYYLAVKFYRVGVKGTVDVKVTGPSGGSSTCTHNYTVQVTKAATCTEEGIDTYTCTKCSHSYTQTMPALGHDYVYQEGYEATCTEEGRVGGAYCVRCRYGESILVIPALGHKDANSDGVCDRCSTVLTASGVTYKISSGNAGTGDTVGLYKWSDANATIDMSSYLGTQTVLRNDSYSIGYYAKPGTGRKIEYIEQIRNGTTTIKMGENLFGSFLTNGVLNQMQGFYDDDYEGDTWEIVIYFTSDSSSGGSGTGTKDIKFKPYNGEYKIVRNGSETMYASNGVDTTYTFNIGDEIELTYTPISGKSFKSFTNYDYSKTLSSANPYTFDVSEDTPSGIRNYCG